MKTLVIAEKPSVAQDIVRALTPESGKFEKHDEYYENARYVVSSAVGHLLEIHAPEEYDVKRGKWSFAHLPVIPPYFDLKPVEKTKTRLSALVKLARRKDVTNLINACDAGREGELIFRLIEQYAAGSKPLGKPVSRLWLQSMTPQAIRDGFHALRTDEQMRPLADAARCRSEADWLVGINGTRAMTAFNSRDGGFFLTTVGRVQTPTLSVVVEREEKIRAFVSRDYWEVQAQFAVEAGVYPGKWFDPAWKKPAAAPATANAAAATAATSATADTDPELRADRLWNEADARAIASAVQGKPATVREETRPATQSSPLLFDLTSLQREANAKFGFSARTTLSLAQSLYERHKALTYPRTDSHALPQDYLPVVQQTCAMLAQSAMPHLAVHAQTAIDQGYLRMQKRVFDDAKVSDHFAIIPTLQAPTSLSEAEQKLYDLVARRFLAVFFPPAQYQLTTRISVVACPQAEHHFKSEGKVLLQPGWLAIYGKEAATEVRDEKTQSLVVVRPGESASTVEAQAKGLSTRPPARYTEATLLGAMEGAGKFIDDEGLREAMREKGLGTPATRASIIEGLLQEGYMVRDGRELVPTAKAFQLMTLLRGLGVEELSRPELTGEWEYKLNQMEQGKLSRDRFMADIADMTQRLVQKAKSYDGNTVPGNFATLRTPCPQCGGVVKENYRRYACVGPDGQGEGCGFSFGKMPAGRVFEAEEVERFLHDRRIGPLEGFRSKAGLPFAAEMVLRYDDEARNYRLEFDFGTSSATLGPVDFSGQEPLGACPRCRSGVFEHGKEYVCEKAVPSQEQVGQACTFRSGKTILQQAVEPVQMRKLLAGGRTDVLQRFVSARTRRPFQAALVWDAQQDKVTFEFTVPKKGVASSRARTAAAAKATGATGATAATVATRATKTTRTTKATQATQATKVTKGAKATPATRTASATQPAAKARAPRSAPSAAGSTPSAELAAVIGAEPVVRTQVIKKLWDYIKAQQLQDPADRRTIRADDKLQAVFGKPQVHMFEIAGLVGQHLR
ncbi:DNA topoisomerase III [Candidatus Symbiobacter mobilis]|nr:DNA topoisomerase III [Candidatus Symbiobacter mobilis]